MPFTSIMENGKQPPHFDHGTDMPILWWVSMSLWNVLHVTKVWFFWNWEAPVFHAIDFHQQTVGIDCARCHTPKSWIVEDITGCMKNLISPYGCSFYSGLCRLSYQWNTCQFQTYRGDLSGLSQVRYIAAKQPDHQANNFSTGLFFLSFRYRYSLEGDPILHSFFPLEQGHKGIDCFGCHKPPAYTGLDANCISCHADAINAAQSVDHSLFPTDCKLCHTLCHRMEAGWFFFTRCLLSHLFGKT